MLAWLSQMQHFSRLTSLLPLKAAASGDKVLLEQPSKQIFNPLPLKNDRLISFPAQKPIKSIPSSTIRFYPQS
jgi:hypothetical protein